MLVALLQQDGLLRDRRLWPFDVVRHAARARSLAESARCVRFEVAPPSAKQVGLDAAQRRCLSAGRIEAPTPR
jgi:hypothetical protein